MRLALVLQRDFPHGGLQRDARILAGLLAARGHAVSLVCRDAEGPAPQGVERRLVPVPAGSNHARDLAFARTYPQAVVDCDLVVGFDKLPGLDLYFAADPCYAARTSWLARATPRGRVRLALEAAVFGPTGARRILLLTETQAETYRHVYGSDRARFRLLPPLRDPAFRPPQDATARRTAERNALGLMAETPLLLFLGRDGRLKGLDRLLSALAPLGSQAPQTLCLVDEPEQWQRRATRLGLGQRVRCRDTSDALLPLYLVADLLVHPARREAAGKVIAEALGCGLPVICTANCGYAPLVARSGGGVIIENTSNTKELQVVLATTMNAERRLAWRRAAERAAPILFLEDGHAVALAAIETLAAER